MQASTSRVLAQPSPPAWPEPSPENTSTRQLPRPLALVSALMRCAAGSAEAGDSTASAQSSSAAGGMRPDSRGSQPAASTQPAKASSAAAAVRTAPCGSDSSCSRCGQAPGSQAEAWARLRECKRVGSGVTSVTGLGHMRVVATTLVR